MQIEWEDTINDLLAERVACRRCGSRQSLIGAGYSRAPGSAEFAPRCVECSDKDVCESRKLVVLCDECARELRVRVKHVDAAQLTGLLMEECRRDLEECLDYMADYWREDLELADDDESRFEQAAPEAFVEEEAWRKRLEEEYISYHKWFRQHRTVVPDPGWRSQYAEEIIGLGYETLLGD